MKDPDGGSINFTGSTVNAGIEIIPESEATDPVIIRGDAPSVSGSGDATVTVLGNKPKVLLEGSANDVIIEAPNSEFELSAGGDATRITIAETALGSKITASRNYEFELLFTEDQTVADVVNSGLFGDKEIRVVGYPMESEPVQANQLLKLDSMYMSTLYPIEESTLLEIGQDGVVGTEDNLFKVDTNDKKVYFKGIVTAQKIRNYLNENDLFNDGPLSMSFYEVQSGETLLVASDQFPDRMRVLVGTNEQHGLYILTKKTN